MLSANGLNYCHEGSAAPLWRPLSFETGDARLVLLSGESGSGKSTLLRILCGLLPGFRGGRLEGRVSILGKVAPAFPDGRVGLLFQNADVMLHSPRVSDELLARAGASGRESRGAKEQQGLSHGWLGELVEELRLGPLLDRPIVSLSGGEQQRLALAAVLVARPQVVLLDEPTSNLDDRAAADLIHLVTRCMERFGVRFIISEHRCGILHTLVDGAVWLGTRQDDAHPSGFVGEEPAASGQSGWGCRHWSGRPGSIPVEVMPERLESGALRRLADLSRSDRHAEPILVCRDISCSRAGRTVLDGVDIELRRGEIVGLSGPNGAGKSTLLLLLAGGLKPARGAKIEWKAGRRGGRTGVAVGLLLQNPLHQLFCETVREEVELAARNARLPITNWIEPLLIAAGLADLADRASLSLSYGEQQRTALAAAMSAEPAVVLLDEPTHGMDARRLQRIIRFVIEARQSGMTFVIASHDRAFLESFSDRVLTLHEGRLTEAACAGAR